MAAADGHRKPTLRSEFERAERFAGRAFAAERQVAAVIALLDRTDAAAAEGQHLARLSTREIREALENARVPTGAQA